MCGDVGGRTKKSTGNCLVDLPGKARVCRVSRNIRLEYTPPELMGSSSKLHGVKKYHLFFIFYYFISFMISSTHVIFFVQRDLEL
jgi:hypothetical protein